MSITNPNDNGIGNKKLPTEQVDQEASRLAGIFSNSGYEPFYCKAIYTLGIQRVRELEGRVHDAASPGRLFTKLAKEEMSRKVAKNRLDTIDGWKSERGNK